MSQSSTIELPGGWRVKTTYLLILLFPIAGMSVRHWISYIFFIISLLALRCVFEKRHDLYKEEKILLTFFLIFPLTDVLSSLINGWGYEQVKALGLDIRYLLFIPLYLFFRRLSGAGKMLLYGFLVGSFVLLIQAGYELFVLDKRAVDGIYSSIIFGPYAVLTGFFLISGASIFRTKEKLYIVPLAVAFALIALIFSANRGGYLAFIILTFVLVVMRLRGYKLASALLIALVVPLVAYKTFEIVEHRVDTAIHEVKMYMGYENTALVESGLGSGGQRLEMWKTSLLIIRDNPLFGVGRWNYDDKATIYIEEGLVNEQADNHDQPHNIYLEMLVSNGIVGFIMFLGVLFYSFALFVRNYKYDKLAAPVGIILTIGYASFGLTEAAPFVRSNFLSIYLVCLSVIFSWHMQQMHDMKTVEPDWKLKWRN